MLEVLALCCARGEREIFHDVTFSVGAGEWVHVRGENGAGKTTLLKALCGLLRPMAGAVAWNGQRVDQIRDAYHRALAYLGHATALKDDMDASENLRAACAIADAPPVRAIGEALHILGLDPSDRAPVRTLSQGQKRRVALARLALTPAKLWILDEPLAALDAGAVASVLALLDRHLDQGGSLVLTSHQSVVLARSAREVWVGAARENGVDESLEVGPGDSPRAAA